MNIFENYLKEIQNLILINKKILKLENIDNLKNINLEIPPEQFNFDFPEIEQGKICDMLEDNIDDKYYYTNRFKVFEEIEKGITKNIYENVLYQYRRYYVRENKSNSCPTLTANMGGGGHNVPLLKDNKGIGKLTPRECFNLQGFPQEYILPDISDSSLYKLAGNAVSIPVVELIAHKLDRLINPPIAQWLRIRRIYDSNWK